MEERTFLGGPVTASATYMRSVAKTMKERAMSHTQRSPARGATSNDRISFGCGGYMRWRIGLAYWQDGMDRLGAHGVNSLSGLRGYGNGF